MSLDRRTHEYDGKLAESRRKFDRHELVGWALLLLAVCCLVWFAC